MIERKRLSGAAARQAAADRQAPDRQAAEHEQAARRLAELEAWAAVQPREEAGDDDAA